MTMWDAGTITMNGIEVPVLVDDYDGSWTAVYAGQRLSAETRDKLKGRLSRLTKKAKAEVSVAVVKITPIGGGGTVRVQRGFLTGLHSANGNVLATWTDAQGKDVKEQLTGWRDGGTVFAGGDTTDEQIDEYDNLLRQQYVIEKKIRTWLEAHTIRPKTAVGAALSAQAGGDGDE